MLLSTLEKPCPVRAASSFIAFASKSQIRGPRGACTQCCEFPQPDKSGPVSVLSCSHPYRRVYKDQHLL